MNRFLVAGVIFLLCLAPVVSGFAELGRSPDRLMDVFSAAILTRFARTLLCAAFVAGLATACGFLLAFAAVALPGRIRWAAYVALGLPFVFPPYLYALAWIEGVAFFNRSFGFSADAPAVRLYSFQGVVALQALRYIPIATGLAAIVVRFCDLRAIEAALLSRGRRAALQYVFVPSIKPMINVAFLAILMLALSDGSIPALLQIDLYPVDIQARFSASFDVPGAFALTILPIAAGLACLACCTVLVHFWSRQQRIDTDMRAGEPPLLLPAPIAGAALTLYLLLAVVVPLGITIGRIGSVRAFTEAWRSISAELALSAAVASVTALVVTSLTIATIAAFRRPWAASAAAACALLVTGPGFGIGSILLWNHPGWRGAVYDSAAILVVVASGRVLFIALLGGVLAAAIQPRSAIEAATLARVAAGRLFASIILPPALPLLLLSGVLALLIAFVEIEAVALVAPPGATPLAVRIAGLMHYGPSELVHAASAISSGFAILLVSIAALVARKGWSVTT